MLNLRLDLCLVTASRVSSIDEERASVARKRANVCGHSTSNASGLLDRITVTADAARYRILILGKSLTT